MSFARITKNIPTSLSDDTSSLIFTDLLSCRGFWHLYSAFALSRNSLAAKREAKLWHGVCLGCFLTFQEA